MGERVVAPERVTQEVDEIQPVPFGADAGILEMLSGIGALVEDGAAWRQNLHGEAIENTGITGCVDRIDDGVGTLNIHGDLCVRRDVDPFQLKQETTDRNRALHRGGISPDRLPAVGFQRASGRRGERIPG